MMREVEGGAAVHWESGRRSAPAARGVEKKGRETLCGCTGSDLF